MLSFNRLAGAAAAFLVLMGCFDRAVARAAAPSPHVLELFTAQGCTGCAEADQAIKGVIGRPNVLVLAFPVDYWDYLGWKDTLARPEFTQRQAAYKARFKLRETYSPQLVIDGRSEGAGVDMARIDQATAAAAKRTVKLRVSRGRVRVSGRAPPDGADIWLVRYDPQDQAVQVKAGENRGKTLSQQNIVRSLVKLARWRGRSATYDLPPGQDPALRTVVLVQVPRGGAILGIAQF
jgi:hypothetical protein